MWNFAYHNNYNDFDHPLFKGKYFPYEDFSNKTYTQLIEHFTNYKGEIEFKNIFLKHISEKGNIKKWVDIEDEYYYLLKKSFQNKNGKYKIVDLNKDFEVIKTLLSDYLLRVEKLTLKDNEARRKTMSYKRRFGYKIFSPIQWKDFSEKALNDEVDRIFNQYLKYIESENQAVQENKLSQNLIDLFQKLGKNANKNDFTHLLLSGSAPNHFDLIPENTLFLNFNYTHTDSLYGQPNEFKNAHSDSLSKTSFIHIHGSISAYDENPIIFGFGDELDDDYMAIEKLNDNEYLENIKYIKYSETDNYKKLLEYVNSGYYQVYIMGHSCGIS